MIAYLCQLCREHPHWITIYSEDGEPLHICEECAERTRKDE
ncbi:MAG: hypothetical protein WC455_27150 [Dehalococcoidia bacterium]